MRKNQKIMKNLKSRIQRFIFTVTRNSFICLITIILFAQCSDRDEFTLDPNVSEHHFLQFRGGCEPGSTSIAAGRLKFNTRADFDSTLKFLGCATEAEIQEWRDELEIETAQKALIAFLDAACCDTTITAGEYEDLEEEFESRVKFWTNGSNEREVSTKYKYFTEFVNSNGEFQIDSTIVKIAGGLSISVLDTSLVDIEELDENTETDAENGVFVYDIAEQTSIVVDCPLEHDETDTYDGGKKRFKMHYEVFPDVIFHRPGGQVRQQPVLTVQTNGLHQRKRIGIWWCNKIDFYYGFSVSIIHNWGQYGIPSPLLFGVSFNVADECRVSTTKAWQSQLLYLQVDDPEVEVGNVSQTMATLGNSGEYDCPQ